MDFQLNTNPEHITAVALGATDEDLNNLCHNMVDFFIAEQKSHQDEPTDVMDAFNKWIKSNPECLKDYKTDNPMDMFRLGFAFCSVMNYLSNPFANLMGGH